MNFCCLGATVRYDGTVRRLLHILTFFLIAAGFAAPRELCAQSVSVSSIRVEDLAEYEAQPEAVKKLVAEALKLTEKKLSYTYGSASPKAGGMDCSGTVCYLLKSMGLSEVPRMSHTIYLWAEKQGNLTKLSQVHSPSHPSLKPLQPGDLVFWEGTYSVRERNPPISHVMIYLGTLKKDGMGVLFGASSGRRYRGKKIHGVSVFDFKVPSAQSKAKMVAFGPVPGIRTEGAEEESETEAGNGGEEEPARKGPVRQILEALAGKKNE